MKRRNGLFKSGIIAMAFGTGLLLACFLPAKFLIGVLAAIVIILGLYCSKCC